MTWSRVIGFIIKIKLRLTLNKAPTLDIDIVRILWRIFKWWIFLNRMWSFALEHRAHWIDRSFKWQTRKFLAHFWHLRNSIKAEDQIDNSFQGITLSTWVIVASFAISIYVYQSPRNSFSNDNPFPSSVFLSFWATCPPTTLTSTENRISFFLWISNYRDWRSRSSLGMLRCLTGYDKKWGDVMRVITVREIQPGILHDDNWSEERDDIYTPTAPPVVMLL